MGLFDGLAAPNIGLLQALATFRPTPNASFGDPGPSANDWGPSNAPNAPNAGLLQALAPQQSQPALQQQQPGFLNGGTGIGGAVPPPAVGNFGAPSEALNFLGPLGLASDQVSGPRFLSTEADPTQQVQPTQAQWFAPLIDALKPMI